MIMYDLREGVGGRGENPTKDQCNIFSFQITDYYQVKKVEL